MNSIWRFVRNHLPGTIIGILISVATYLLTREKVEPIFVVDSVRSELISKENIIGQPIRILKMDGEEVTKDLVSVTFYLFNRGSKALLWKEHVQNPLRIQLTDSTAEIVSYRILKSSRPDINASLTLDTTSAFPALNISFTFLEQDDGFTGQITYLGDPSTDLVLHGTVIGAKDLNGYRPTLWENALLFLLKSLMLVGPVAIFILALIQYVRLNTGKDNVERQKEMISKQLELGLEELRKGELSLANMGAKVKALSLMSYDLQRLQNPADTKGILVVMMIVSLAGAVYGSYRFIYEDNRKEKPPSGIFESIPQDIKP